MNSGTKLINHKNATGVFILVLALSDFMPGQAFAQSSNIGPLIDRMERLERDIRTLNVTLSRGRTPGSQPLVSGAQGGAAGGVPNTSIARFEARLSSMEEDIRAATGTVEGISFDMDQVKKRLEKLVGDVDYRLTTLENGAAARAVQGGSSGAPETRAASSPGAVTQAGAQPSFASGSGKLGSISQSELDSFRKAQGLPADGDGQTQVGGTQAGRAQNAQPGQVQSAAIPLAPPSILPPGTPNEQYRFAMKLLRQAKYDEAEAAWKEFLEKHGKNDLAENAQYWLGETYYVRKRYKPAASVFYQGFKTNPTGSKAVGTLLKLGMSLANLDKKNEACTTFEKLKVDFPDASERILQVVKAQWKKSGCK